MNMQTADIVVNIPVIVDQVEECVVRLRAGEHLFHVPEGMVCKDAFDCHTLDDSGKAIVRARFAAR